MFSPRNINLSPIKTIELLASKTPDAISLAQGIPSFDTPEIIKKAAFKALNRGAAAKYSLTYGLPELRETIEQKLAEDGMYYDFEHEIIATAGAIEALAAALIATIIGRKNEIILFSPSYASYSELVKIAGGKPIFVNLVENGLALSQSKGWVIDFKNLAKKINSKTAAILLCNPNNPTGTIFPKSDLLKIAELTEKKKFFIISDEVYKDFVYDLAFSSTGTGGSLAPTASDRLGLSPRWLSASLRDQARRGSETFRTTKNQGLSFGGGLFSLAQIPQLRKIVIRVFSLSKAYAMTGWRIGFLHSDEEIVDKIIKVHDSLVTCAPVISQYAAMAALDFADKSIEEFRRQFLARRDLICRRLDELSDFFSYQKPEAAYFVFPRILPAAYKALRCKDSWNFSLNLLKKAKVALVPGIAFGPNGENHIRMSFGRSEKDINKAMERIKSVLFQNG